MPDTKITALTAITTVDPAVDVLPIVDVSDTTMAASGTTKKITSNQILGAGCTATLASATISGDLTVDTSTLKVDSANNRVGIGTATPGFPLDIIGASGVGVRIYESSTGNNNRLQITQEGTETRFNSAFTAGSAFYTWQIAGSEQMRLNSTGLGVGVTPNRKLHIGGTGNQVLRVETITSGDPSINLLASGVNDAVIAYDRTNNYLRFDVSAATGAFIIGPTGNVGVGVTPSAWNTIGPVLQIEQASLVSEASNQLYLSANAYFASGNWNYINNSQASQYYQSAGSHVWRSATASTGTISFSTLMTLDANGNLILQSSATPATLTTNGQLTVNATSNTNLRFSYRGSDGVTRVANLTLA